MVGSPAAQLPKVIAMVRERTEQEMIDRATEPDWYGIPDQILKPMIKEGKIKDPMPPDMRKRLGLD